MDDDGQDWCCWEWWRRVAGSAVIRLCGTTAVQRCAALQIKDIPFNVYAPSHNLWQLFEQLQRMFRKVEQGLSQTWFTRFPKKKYNCNNNLYPIGFDICAAKYLVLWF